MERTDKLTTKTQTATRPLNRYAALIEDIFRNHYRKAATSFEFNRAELESTARRKKIRLPKNLGDVIYSFRYRVALPASVVSTAPEGKRWEIKPAGTGKYRFELVADRLIMP